MAEITLTNRMFINTMLEPEDVPKIIRVWDRYLEKRAKHEVPIWIKEQLYEEWLELPFNVGAWNDAGVSRAVPGSIPKIYTRSIKRFTKPVAEIGRVLNEEGQRTKEALKKNPNDRKYYFLDRQTIEYQQNLPEEERDIVIQHHGKGVTVYEKERRQDS